MEFDPPPPEPNRGYPYDNRGAQLFARAVPKLNNWRGAGWPWAEVVRIFNIPIEVGEEVVTITEVAYGVQQDKSLKVEAQIQEPIEVGSMDEEVAQLADGEGKMHKLVVTWEPNHKCSRGWWGPHSCLSCFYK